MAAKAKKRSAGPRKKSRGKSVRKTASARGGAKSRGKAKKSAAKRPAAKKSAARTPAAKKQPAKRPAVKKKKSPSRSRSPMQRVTRVAKEVAQQATAAVTEGVETLKEMGESIVERVTG